MHRVFPSICATYIIEEQSEIGEYFKVHEVYIMKKVYMKLRHFCTNISLFQFCFSTTFGLQLTSIVSFENEMEELKLQPHRLNLLTRQVSCTRAQVHATMLLLQLLANVPRKAAAYGLCLSPATHTQETQMGLPASAWPRPCGYFGVNQWMKNVFLSPFQINK